jgi:hypothetical protein
MNVGLLYYRADLLARYGFRPPETYDELAEQVRRIRAGEGDPRLDGYLWQGKQYEGGMVNVLEALWANGARLLDETGRPFPEPERAREALAFLRGLIERGVSPGWVTAADEELTRRPSATAGDLPAELALRARPLRVAGLPRARQGGRRAAPASASWPGRGRLHRRRAPGGERAHAPPGPRGGAGAVSHERKRPAGHDRGRRAPALAPRTLS